MAYIIVNATCACVSLTLLAICCMPPTSDPLNHCHFFFVL